MRFDQSKDAGHQLNQLLNSGIDFTDNVRGTWLEFKTTAGTMELQHNLGYVPTYFFVGYRDGQVEVWAERASEWNRFKLYLGASVAGRTVRVFVH